MSERKMSEAIGDRLAFLGHLLDRFELKRVNEDLGLFWVVFINVGNLGVQATQ